MADQPTRSEADSGPPAGDRPPGRQPDDQAPAAPLTVAELLARSGTGVPRRRAERRESGELTGRQQPLGDDGLPVDRPPLRGGILRDPAPPPAATFLPTGWQPAMPGPVEPPADLGRFRALVRGFLDAAVARFGAAEVGRWRFEAWNEPNMPPFFRGDFGRYLDLYRATAEALRESGHRIRLGGPVIAWLPPGGGPMLMRRFVEFLRAAAALQQPQHLVEAEGGQPDQVLRCCVGAGEECAATIEGGAG